MKFASVLCVLAVVAFSVASCERSPPGQAKIKGCKPQDVPRNIRNLCVSVSCMTLKNGKESRGVMLCNPTSCPSGKAKRSPGDSTKTYPDCCPVDLECL